MKTAKAMVKTEKCRWCGQMVTGEMALHYAGDNCPGLVEAWGALTPEGKKREKSFGRVAKSKEDREIDREERRQREMVRKKAIYARAQAKKGLAVRP